MLRSKAMRLEVHHYFHGGPESLLELLDSVKRLERTVSKIDDKLQVFKADVDAQLGAIRTSLTSVGGSITNIAADEQNILNQLAVLGDTDLTPAQQTLLQSIVTDLTTVSDSTATAATSLQALADQIPDIPPPPPPPVP